MHTLDQLRAGQLNGTKRLTLSCGLTEFPTEIFDLAESLEILDLSNNHLKALPQDFGRLKHLKGAFFFNNEFEELPAVVTQCPQLDILGFKSNRIQRVSAAALSPNLRWLILTNNQIKALPSAMGRLRKLQKLMLAGNQLRSLPAEMAACRSLELLRISANLLQALPTWLLKLPRLSWLAYAGNPFCKPYEILQTDLPIIDWAELELGKTLGEGASGIISQGLLRPSRHPVAVKLFKGTVTSDGSPTDEMRACMAAGTHPNLIGALGKIANAPENQQGLVLALIPPQYRTLGGPPSLTTCTRDTYTSGTSFSLSTILQISQGVAAAAAHLHSRGMTHGDLYPHNTLVNEAGESLLGDFGAASPYDPNDSVIGTGLERLEVRAFGCLLEDLLNRYQFEDTVSQSAQAVAVEMLRHLQRDCMQPVLDRRPLFVKICGILASVEQMAQTVDLALQA